LTGLAASTLALFAFLLIGAGGLLQLSSRWRRRGRSQAARVQ